MNALPESFYVRETALVARELLGALLVRTTPTGAQKIGRIVETEAYLGVDDLACHSSKGRTPRTEVMFGPPGRAYIYFVYGMHYCLNAVTRPAGIAEAVLIRAVEPLTGFPPGTRTDGPGRLCKAFDIDRSLHGLPLDGALAILPGATPVARIEKTPRIGVDYAGAWSRRLLRFHERNNPHVSRAR